MEPTESCTASLLYCRRFQFKLVNAWITLDPKEENRQAKATYTRADLELIFTDDRVKR
jgi:hypothetical protein